LFGFGDGAVGRFGRALREGEIEMPGPMRAVETPFPNGYEGLEADESPMSRKI
jgi:hypothetical protein